MLAASLEAGGRARAEEFSMQHLAERYVEIYREVAALQPR
jgi:hypothetical protein